MRQADATDGEPSPEHAAADAAAEAEVRPAAEEAGSVQAGVAVEAATAAAAAADRCGATGVTGLGTGYGRLVESAPLVKKQPPQLQGMGRNRGAAGWSAELAAAAAARRAAAAVGGAGSSRALTIAPPGARHLR